MSSGYNFKNSISNVFNAAETKRKASFDSMLEAILMVALQNKIDIKKMNHEEIISFVKKEKNNIGKELDTIEKNKKISENKTKINDSYNKRI